MCGFSQLPHRTTFNRFIKRLADHQDLIEEAMASLTNELADALPGFGEKIAIDSTTIRTHANPNRKVVSDPEASWTAKTSARAKKGGKDWYFGYKSHTLADATYNIPIVGFTTTASRNDSPELPVLLDQARREHSWFKPKFVMADRGYDSTANHRAVLARGAVPIIAIRNPTNGEKFHEGIYSNEGAPACMGMKPMEYVRSDPDKGHLYRCSLEGCHLKERKGVRYCHDSVWENRTDNPRLFGPIRRGSPEWKNLYSLRQSIERVFKSLKQSRRLESHCIRGLRSISLHATMSVLTFQATVLVRLGADEAENLCWMVRKVA